MTSAPTTSGRIGWPARDFPRQAKMLRLDQLRFHLRNIRKAYTDLDELAASINNEGVLEPLLAHRRWEIPDGQPLLVELLAGHRRMLAAEIAGLDRVPVTLRPRLDDDEAMFLGEDQKEPLTSEERRAAIVALHHEFTYDLREISERLGINLATVRALYDGHDVAPARTNSRPPPAPRARTRAPHRSAPKIRPTQVHHLVAGWDSGRISRAEVITELRSMLGDWTPTSRADQSTAEGAADEADGVAETGDDKDEHGEEVSGDAVL